MSRRTLPIFPVILAIAILGTGSALAAAPRYDIKAGWGDTNLGAPDAQENVDEGQFFISARNIGDASSSSALTITDQFPAGVTITAVAWENRRGASGEKDLASLCSGLTTETLTCTIPGSRVSTLLPAPGFGEEISSAITDGYMPPIYVDVAVSPGASGTGTNTATISGGSASTTTDADQVPLRGLPSKFGLVPASFEADVFSRAYPFGAPSRQAGDHPFEQRVNFDLSEKTGRDIGGDGLRYTLPAGLVKDVEVTLPRGMIGNPEALPKCDPTVFAGAGATRNSTGCPADTQVGYLTVYFADGTSNHGQGSFNDLTLTRVAVYNLDPPKGVLADFGFDAGTFVLGHIYPTLDPAQDYAIKALTPDISSALSVRGSQVTFWGVPGDPAHNPFRYYPQQQEDGDVLGAPFGNAAIRPLLTNPMDCGIENGGARIRLDSYNQPGEFTSAQESGNSLDVTGCEDQRFRFKPQIALQPTDVHAGAPTGLDVHLEVPQRNDEVEEAGQLYAENGSTKGISTPPLKKAVVTFPEGMTLNPSAAQGLGTCTSAEIGLGTDDPVSCPDNSQYGRLILHSPALPQNKTVEGFIYVAKQNDNPFHNFLSLYLVIQDSDLGLLVKVPGRIDLDPKTGQIVTTFDDLPQLPVSDMQMTFKGGVRAGLVEPSTCGQKTIEAEFFTWQDPDTARVVNSSYDIAQKPDGSPCVTSLGERPFGPNFAGGTTSNTAGSYSPFVFRLTRSDDDQEFSRVGVTLPEGLAAKFAGVEMCPDAGIAKAEERREPGEGALEQAQPSCPESSRIGTTEVGTGVGVPLTWVPGNVYLAGPYRGAPLSIVAISPAVVGPFDLGVVAIRTALTIDPETAQGTALSDPFPQVLQGIPVRIRDIRLNLDRPDFTLNPTSCAEKRMDAHVTGTGNDIQAVADDTAADLSTRFQAAECAGLGFKPKLTFRLFGGTHRGAFPKLKATVTYPRKGAYANIAAAQVTLPRSEFIENAHFNSICTRVQFAARECPAGSVYGHAVAKTPLFEAPLEGPVYLRSSSHPLPDVVAVLRGPTSQPVEVDLDGQVDSVRGGVRNTFKVVPDAPVERFSLTLLGGKKGLFVNSRNLCAKTYRATAKFTAQNARRLTLHPALKIACKAVGKSRTQR
jgi:hypothetical protein